MAYTGAPGTRASQPANLVPGAPRLLAVAADSLRLIEIATGQIKPVDKTTSALTMSFTGVPGTNASQPGNVEPGTGLAVTGLSVSVSEALNFVEVASYPTVPVSASDAMTLVESATVGRRINVSVSESIVFSESEPLVGPHYEFAASRLNLIEEATGHLSTVNLSVSEGILFIESAGRRIAVSVAEALALAESTKNPTIGFDILALIETAIGAKGQVISDSLTFVEIASVLGTFGRSVADTLSLTEAASFFVLNPSVACTYSPFIGASNGVYTPPSATPPAFGVGTLTLTYPFVSPTTTLVLRNPDMGNNDKLTYNRLNQQTRGGTLRVFADPQWPKFKTRSFTVTAIPDDKRDALLQFLEDSLGQQIGLLDWDGRQWQGIITNPDTAVTQVGGCNHTVSIDFEGDLV